MKNLFNEIGRMIRFPVRLSPEYICRVYIIHGPSFTIHRPSPGYAASISWFREEGDEWTTIRKFL